MQKLTTCLWFDGQAEEAVKFYTTIFKNSKVGKILRNGKANLDPEGTVLTASFELEGREFLALNGGPHYKFTPATSFIIHCENQEEVDYYWEKLLEGGGRESQCGWLDDKFGVAWQVSPTILPKLLSDPDPVKANRVMEAMMQMVKLDIKKMQQAYDGKI